MAELMSFPKFDEEEIESQSGLVACLRPQEPNKWCGGKKKKRFKFRISDTWVHMPDGLALDNSNLSIMKFNWSTTKLFCN